MRSWKLFLGDYESAFQQCLEELARERVLLRLWQKDHTLWSENPEEIVNRLDWLEAPCRMQGMVRTLEAFAKSVREAGFTKAVLLGMGGSSLAPLMFSQMFQKALNSLDVEVLDSTDPEIVRSFAEKGDPRTTLYIVSTKSGTTLETLVLFRYFFTLLHTMGEEEPGENFVAITDPGSPLIAEARLHRFREIFENNPNIGGRYSIFSFFGLLPAALLGIDLDRLLEEARKAMECSFPDQEIPDNPGAVLGAFLGGLYRRGCDKIVLLFTSPALETFGLWLEQLLAESTGKMGKAILPVVEREWKVYPRQDVGYVVFFTREEELPRTFLTSLEGEGRPYLAIPFETPHNLGQYAYFFELATALAGYFLRLNPFDQPDVESTKRFTREMLRNPQELLPEHLPQDGEIRFLPEKAALSLKDALDDFLGKLHRDGYLAIQAFTPYDPSIEKELWTLGGILKEEYGQVVTLGYGPRYLHSTGQLHKGDGGRGSFLQIVTESDEDLPIPDRPGDTQSSLGFGALKMAQALADRRALREKGRNVLTLIVPARKALETLVRIREILRKE